MGNCSICGVRHPHPFENPCRDKLIKSALKLQRLVKERMKNSSEELCFGIPVDIAITTELKYMVKESEE